MNRIALGGRPRKKPRRADGPVTRGPFRAAACAFGLFLAGCAPLLTGTTDPAQVKSIMESTNARGCIYARASAAPWAQATTIIIGTWGQDGPRFEDCWKGIPPGIP